MYTGKLKKHLSYIYRPNKWGAVYVCASFYACCSVHKLSPVYTTALQMSLVFLRPKMH